MPPTCSRTSFYSSPHIFYILISPGRLLPHVLRAQKSHQVAGSALRPESYCLYIMRKLTQKSLCVQYVTTRGRQTADSPVQQWPCNANTSCRFSIAVELKASVTHDAKLDSRVIHNGFIGLDFISQR